MVREGGRIGSEFLMMQEESRTGRDGGEKNHCLVEWHDKNGKKL